MCTIYAYIFVYYSICSPFFSFLQYKLSLLISCPLLLFDSFFPDGKTWAKELAPPIADRFAHLSNSNQKDLIHRAASTKCYMHEMLRKVLHVTEDHLPKILYKSKQIKCCSSGGRKSLRRPITFFFFFLFLSSDPEDSLHGTATLHVPDFLPRSDRKFPVHTNCASFTYK